ncbi:MAG TPA: NHL repeat-containing protein [Caldilineaceae bacterium]|nr:NHL repeat-containing protein [Caldilineaceae bacterium]
MSVPLIAAVVWINQWHIVNVVQVHSQQMPIALILQQLQESAATNGGGMPVYVVADDNIQRMSLIVRAHGVPRERVHYLQGDELLASPQICGEAHEPSVALIEATHPQLAQLEQYFAACWPGNQLAPIKNQANEVIFYRFLTQTGVDELAKAPAQRQALRVVPDTIAMRKPTSLAVSENDRLFVLAPETHRLWQLDTHGQLLHSFVITPTLPTALALTAHKEIVVAGQDPTALLTWYSPAGIVLRQLGEETVRLHPTGMVADPVGDLYVSDGDNGRIVRLSAAAAETDEATTVAALTANGELRNPGALALAADGTLWVIDLGSRRLLQVTPDDQLRTALALPTIRELERAHLLVTEQGDLLISSPGDGRILRLNQEGQVVERSFGFQYPTALALASDGRLFVADTVVDQIAVLPPLRTALPAVALPTLTIADEQPISPLSPLYTTNPASVTDADQGADFRYIGAGNLGQPLGVAIGANGNLYVADAGRAQLAIFAPDGTLIRRVTEGDGPLEQPNDLVFDHAGTLLLLDAGRGALLTFDGEGNYQGDFLADSALLGDARGIGVAPDGTIWVASTRRGLVAQIDSQGQILLEYPSTPAADGQPVDVAVDREGRIYLVEASTLQLVQLSRLGIRRNSWSLPGFNTGHAPHLAIGADNALYLTAPEQGLVTQFDEQGRVLASWQLPRSDRDGAVKPIGIAVNAEGKMYVASAEQGVVVEIAPR